MPSGVLLSPTGETTPRGPEAPSSPRGSWWRRPSRGSGAGRKSSRYSRGLRARVRRLPLGILTDSVPFARRGVPALTIGRLTWRTLRLIHTPRDTPDGLSLETSERIGRALAAN